FNPAEYIPSWGYSSVALQRFRAFTGRSDLPDPTDREWMDWRREQITSIVRKIYIEASAIKPRVRISADTITYGDIAEGEDAWIASRPFWEVLQDWRGWMAEGILDLNIPMNYRRRVLPPSGARTMFDVWNAFIMDHQYDRQAAIGTALYLNAVPDSIAQIRAAITPSPTGRSAAGWVGFSYRTPDSAVNQRMRPPEAARVELAQAMTIHPALDVLRADDPGSGLGPVFPTLVPVPSMPWKRVPTKGAVHGSVIRQDGTPADQVWVRLRDAVGAPVASRLTTGGGWIGFVDLPVGVYTLTASGPSGGEASAAVTVTAGRVAAFSLVLGR
ncbi:MAG TPA: family 10 glycosylhydrolase, partial [bacterium]